MRSPSTEQGQHLKIDAGWTNGMNSVRHPWLLPEGQYRRATNILNRGGIIQTRPGFGMRLILPDGNLQGMTFFKATKNEGSSEYLVFAVDGSVYVAPFPLNQPRDWEEYRLKNLTFDKAAPSVYFCDCEKTVQVMLDKTLRIVPTYNVLIIQDGINAAAFWDGEESRHLSEAAPDLETPRGTWMAFAGGRLWIARDKLVIASDLLDPLKFIERTEGEGRGDFAFNLPITGLTSFMGDNREEALVVFTEERSSLLRAGIRKRASWASTSNFQSILFPSTGCVSGKSVCFQGGFMWWYAAGGLVSSDVVASSQLTSEVKFKDAEMAFSKQFLYEDLTGVCATGFENFLLVAAPVRQNLNTEMFVLDYTSMFESTSENIPSWASVWTGIRPVELVQARAEKRRRVFAASIDYVPSANGSYNHIWELFMPDREDSFFELDSDFALSEYRQPIYCDFETRLLGDGLEMKTFQYAEIDLCEIAGEVSVRADFRGRSGPYKSILCKKILAPIDISVSGVNLTPEQIVEAGNLMKQSRHVVTEVATLASGCFSPEREYSDVVDKAFSLILRWCGQMAVESIRMFADAFPEKATGKCEKDESQATLHYEDGRSLVFDRRPDFVSPFELFREVGTQKWLSVKEFTSTLPCASGSITPPISVTASANYQSGISQIDADAKALAAATQSATNYAAYLRSQWPCHWDSTRTASFSTTTPIQVSTGNFIKCFGFIHIAGRQHVCMSGKFSQDNVLPRNGLTARLTSGAQFSAFGIDPNGFVGDNDIVQVIGVGTGTDLLVRGGTGSLTYAGSQTKPVFRTILGELDIGFNWPYSNASTHVTSITDGRLFSASNNEVTRHTASGEVDNTFSSTASLVMTFSSVHRVAGYPGGECLVAGLLLGGQVGVVRLLSSGALDPDFITVAVAGTSATSLVIDASGRVLLSTNSNGVHRFSSAGVVDATFNVYAAGFVSEIIVLPSGYLTVSPSGSLVKLLDTGNIDLAFSSNLGSGFNGEVLTAALVNGVLFIGGKFTSFNGQSSPYLCVLNLDGSSRSITSSVSATASHRSNLNQADADARAMEKAEALARQTLPGV